MDSCYTYISTSLHYAKVSTLVKGTKKCIDLTILSFCLVVQYILFPSKPGFGFMHSESLRGDWLHGVGGGGGFTILYLSCDGNIFAIISNNFTIAVSIRVVTLFHDIFATTKNVFNENVLLREFLRK